MFLAKSRQLLKLAWGGSFQTVYDNRSMAHSDADGAGAIQPICPAAIHTSKNGICKKLYETYAAFCQFSCLTGHFFD